MMTSGQMRAARAILGIDPKDLAARAGLSVPTVQRMECSAGAVRGNVATVTRVIAAFEEAGIEMISEDAMSPLGGRGVRLRSGRG